MTWQAWMLVTWVLVGAMWLVSHVAVLWQGLRAQELDWRWRLLALLPPATPFVAWAGGRRVAPVVWFVLLGAYVVLRIVG